MSKNYIERSGGYGIRNFDRHGMASDLGREREVVNMRKRVSQRGPVLMENMVFLGDETVDPNLTNTFGLISEVLEKAEFVTFEHRGSDGIPHQMLGMVAPDVRSRRATSKDQYGGWDGTIASRAVEAAYWLTADHVIRDEEDRTFLATKGIDRLGYGQRSIEDMLALSIGTLDVIMPKSGSIDHLTIFPPTQPAQIGKDEPRLGRRMVISEQDDSHVYVMPAAKEEEKERKGVSKKTRNILVFTSLGLLSVAAAACAPADTSGVTVPTPEASATKAPANNQKPEATKTKEAENTTKPSVVVMDRISIRELEDALDNDGLTAEEQGVIDNANRQLDQIEAEGKRLYGRVANPQSIGLAEPDGTIVYGIVDVVDNTGHTIGQKLVGSVTSESQGIEYIDADWQVGTGLDRGTLTDWKLGGYTNSRGEFVIVIAGNKNTNEVRVRNSNGDLISIPSSEAPSILDMIMAWGVTPVQAAAPEATEAPTPTPAPTEAPVEQFKPEMAESFEAIESVTIAQAEEILEQTRAYYEANGWPQQSFNWGPVSSFSSTNFLPLDARDMNFSDLDGKGLEIQMYKLKGSDRYIFIVGAGWYGNNGTKFEGNHIFAFMYDPQAFNKSVGDQAMYEKYYTPRALFDAFNSGKKNSMYVRVFLENGGSNSQLVTKCGWGPMVEQLVSNAGTVSIGSTAFEWFNGKPNQANIEKIESQVLPIFNLTVSSN